MTGANQLNLQRLQIICECEYLTVILLIENSWNLCNACAISFWAAVCRSEIQFRRSYKSWRHVDGKRLIPLRFILVHVRKANVYVPFNDSIKPNSFTSTWYGYVLKEPKFSVVTNCYIVWILGLSGREKSLTWTFWLCGSFRSYARL